MALCIRKRCIHTRIHERLVQKHIRLIYYVKSCAFWSYSLPEVSIELLQRDWNKKALVNWSGKHMPTQTRAWVFLNSYIIAQGTKQLTGIYVQYNRVMHNTSSRHSGWLFYINFHCMILTCIAHFTSRHANIANVPPTYINKLCIVMRNPITAGSSP